MDKYHCPACGARGYRGSRCSECFYTPFTEEVAHGNHYHAGEPLRMDTRPQPKRPGQGCSSYSGKRTPAALPKVILIYVAAALFFFVPGGIIPAVIILFIALNKKKR